MVRWPGDLVSEEVWTGRRATSSITTSAIRSSSGSFAEVDLPVLDPFYGALPFGVSLVEDESTSDLGIAEVMIGAPVLIGGGGIGVAVCCKGAGGMVETDRVVETTIDSSGTPGIVPVPSLEPPIPGCLLLVFLLSLRACIMSVASFLAGVKDCTHLSLGFEVADFGFRALKVS
nr:hypothetical protein [Tanacetum cinerariifolium]